jgi:hypothetical protein
MQPRLSPFRARWTAGLRKPLRADLDYNAIRVQQAQVSRIAEKEETLESAEMIQEA